MFQSRWIAQTLCLLGTLLALGCTRSGGDDARQAAETNPPHPAERNLVLLSSVFHVDRIFPSMRGPVHARPVRFPGFQKPELLWLTGYSVEVVSPDGTESESIEFDCHTNLAWDRANPRPPGFHRDDARIFTLTQGQTDIRLPPGFGIPLMSNERLTFNTQVLNLARPDARLSVRHKARLRFVRDRDLETPMKPLFATGAFVMASLEDESLVYNVETPEGVTEDALCQSGELPEGARRVIMDDHQRAFTGHWVVEPGRQEYRTLVTDLMKIPYETTIHFIGVHVHPYSESLTLRDLTTGETLWTSRQETLTSRPGLGFIGYQSSAEGLPVHPNHEYELVSSYFNPTDLPTDAMASMFMYYLDREFQAASIGTSRAPRRAASPRAPGPAGY